MSTLKLGLAQTRQTADLATNADTILRFLEDASRAEVQLLAFPESQTTGYRVDISTAEAPVQAEALAELHQHVARRCGELGIACVLGTETPTDDKPHNSARIINEHGEILGAHHKARLTPLDATAYSPGEAFDTWRLYGITVGVVICFEGFRFPECTRECVAQGAQLIIHPHNNTTRPNDWKLPVHTAMAVTRAAENTVWFASCNICHDEHQNARSLIIAPDGRIVAQSELKQEQLLTAEIDLALATRAMYRFDRDDCGPIIFGTEVTPAEYANAGPMGGTS